jgi:hypothetical protein
LGEPVAAQRGQGGSLPGTGLGRSADILETNQGLRPAGESADHECDRADVSGVTEADPADVLFRQFRELRADCLRLVHDLQPEMEGETSMEAKSIYTKVLTLPIKGQSTPVAAVGDESLLQQKKLGLFCSRKCPGELILKSYDLMQTIRDAGVTVVSGFHAPMDRECLRILLRGKQPIVYCPARSIEGMRLRPEFREPVEQGRMLILSSLPAKERRMTSERAEARNQFVATLADAVLFIHAAPGSRTEALCREVANSGKAVFAIESQYNANLKQLGVRLIGADFHEFFT